MAKSRLSVKINELAELIKEITLEGGIRLKRTTEDKAIKIKVYDDMLSESSPKRSTGFTVRQEGGRVVVYAEDYQKYSCSNEGVSPVVFEVNRKLNDMGYIFRADEGKYIPEGRRPTFGFRR